MHFKVDSKPDEMSSHSSKIAGFMILWHFCLLTTQPALARNSLIFSSTENPRNWRDTNCEIPSVMRLRDSVKWKLAGDLNLYRELAEHLIIKHRINLMLYTRSLDWFEWEPNILYLLLLFLFIFECLSSTFHLSVHYELLCLTVIKCFLNVYYIIRFGMSKII